MNTSYYFDSTLVSGPSQKVGTLQTFLESCLSLGKDNDALAEIASLLYQQEKEQQDYVVNSLHKKKTERDFENEFPNW